MFSRVAFCYPGYMTHTYLSIPSDSPFSLVVTPYIAGGEDIFELVARLALAGALQVVDGGNTFNAYRVAILLRRSIPDPQMALRRIALARVFTCYQMEALLVDRLTETQPVLALDFLSTFSDENVSLMDRWRLLRACTARLRQISRRAPVALWVRQRQNLPPENEKFIQYLRRAADKVWEFEAPAPVLLQPGLF